MTPPPTERDKEGAFFADTGAGHQIAFLLIPDFSLMSYAAAAEPLRAANQLSGRELYRWSHASPGGAPVAASNKVVIVPDAAVGDALAAGSRLFVCAGGNPSNFDDRRVFSWLRTLARRGVAIGGVSGGPWILARAGLLDDRRCTLHWEHIPAFQESFPRATVARSLYEVDDDRITCSGGIAALDLMLRLIADDHGADLAAAVGDWFLHDHIREGLSPQRMSLPLRFGTRDARVLRALEAMEANLEKPLARDEIAARAFISPRQLERLFSRQLGQTIHQYYLHARVAQAGRLRRETILTTAEIATATGFTSATELRRVERRLSDHGPSRSRDDSLQVDYT